MGIALFFVTLFRGVVSVAQGTEPPTIVLVADHADASIIATLRVELTVLGLHPLVVPREDNETTPSDLTEAARRNHAIAAFRVLVDEQKVEVWLADRVTGKVLLREVLVTKDSSHAETEEHAVVARAVELLRASLLELDIDDRPSGDLVAPVKLPPTFQGSSVPANHRPIRSAPRFGLTTSATLLAATSHSGISTGLGLALQWYASDRFLALARLTVPFSDSAYHGSLGRAELTPRFTAVGMRWTTGEGAYHLQGSLESGVGMLLIKAVGIASSGYLARSTFDLDPIVYLGGEVRYSLSSPVAIALGVLGGPGLRPTKVVFDDQAIDHYGRWLLSSYAGLTLIWN
jgi:hypothetical protein